MKAEAITTDHTSGKILWAENLRALAIVCVIILHVTAPVLTSTSPGKIWWAGNIIDSSVRFCVPVLLMLTGALLLPRHYPLNDFIKKRFVRVVIPFLFWTAVYMIYHFYKDNVSFRTEGWSWIKNCILYGSEYHLWYVYMILGIYLFIPVISRWVQNCTEKEILYFLGIWAANLFFTLPLLSAWRPAIDLLNFTGYTGYVILGYYLSVKKFPATSRTGLIALLLIFTGISVTALGTYYTTLANDRFTGTFYEYLTPNVLITASGIFLFMKNRVITNAPMRTIISLINKYSFGIYLVHVLIINLLATAGISWNINNILISIPLVTLCSLVISCAVIFILNKLPLGKYISG